MIMVKAKQVGSVSIFEIHGELRDGHALKVDAEVQEMLRSLKRPPVFLNAEKLVSLDRTGVQALVKTSRVSSKCGLIAPREIWRSLREECFDMDQILNPLKNKVDAAFFFCQEFAEGPERSREFGAERRKYKRLPSTLPVELTAEGWGERKKLFAVATNISEGGLLAEPIDSGSEYEMLFSMDPLDLQFLDVTLWVEPGVSILAKGKLVHFQQGQGKLGIEFYQMDSGLRQWWHDFISNETKSKFLEGFYV